jgi:hypothetical protein
MRHHLQHKYDIGITLGFNLWKIANTKKNELPSKYTTTMREAETLLLLRRQFKNAVT